MNRKSKVGKRHGAGYDVWRALKRNKVAVVCMIIVAIMVSSPVNPAPGCRFAQRCPYATAECTGSELPLVEVGSGHKIRCCHPLN